MSARPACANSDDNARGSRVQGILDQLLHHGGRPLDHFPGGNLVGHPVW